MKKDLFLKIAVFLQVSMISLFAEEKGIQGVKSQLETASGLVKGGGADQGAAFTLIKYIVILLGLIIMGSGIHETFVAQDRGGENKKLNGVLKMIGGAMFIAIIAIYNMFATTQAN